MDGRIFGLANAVPPFSWTNEINKMKACPAIYEQVVRWYYVIRDSGPLVTGTWTLESQEW